MTDRIEAAIALSRMQGGDPVTLEAFRCADELALAAVAVALTCSESRAEFTGPGWRVVLVGKPLFACVLP